MIILIGIAISLLFTLILWRSGGSLTSAAGYVLAFGAFTLLGIWVLDQFDQPWVTGLLTDLLYLRDDLGRSDPWMVIWGAVMLAIFILVFRAKGETND